MAFLFSVALAPAARAAVLYAGSAYQTVSEGESFVVDWFLDTEKVPLNTISLRLNYSPETLEAIDVAPGNSLVSLWVERPEVRGNTLLLTGGVTGGFNASAFPVFRSTFLAKKTGNAQITMDAQSVALASDGRGTPVPLQFRVLNFAVTPKGVKPILITATTHPDSNAWYKDNKVILKFVPRPDEEYSYSFSSNLEIIPDEQKDEVREEYGYENLPDGIYYFKLNTKLTEEAWQEAAVFRVQIDQTPPEEFAPQISSDPELFSGRPFLSFSTVDKTSGIAHYKIKTGAFGFSREAQSPFELQRPLLGNTVKVMAVDRAGNVRTETVNYPARIPLNVLIALGIISAAVLLWKLKSKYN
ncbi:MAG: hypothetical protein HY398_01810 [Candidatus Doudnabacteria bacterium]|nr:hypothetical protein [Candidatus Doudnabacteria bacterium]